ncbi:Cyclin delta-3 isoform 1 [Micractinium conductrix]|uniref:Cyclin delta-3 isoform 1 n=1 Tax=Micractinium conductrix TaxID=554055 RepID=A0A2P6V0M9_9CHLO|nr:Cyclin delta-3 isoform 1 [Micractinium conductrix]|eukprot:PSC67647.1 Cyclin delta-3 isoform 1 [Micractinium conductrix]
MQPCSASVVGARCPRPFAAADASSPRRRGAAPVRASTAAAEHVRYVCEVAVVPGKPKVETLLKVLEAQGQSAVSPAQRQGLHPLAIPLAQQPGGELTCLLRWPEGHKGMELPVVSQARDGTQVRLVARSVEEYLHRALAEEEAGGGGAVAAAAGGDSGALYARGAFAASKLPTMDAYLTRKAGMFPDVAERLVQAHLDKGDQMSALITGEWYMRNTFFPGWGRPYEFNSQLLARVGRGEEARDVARIALRMPWWSFVDGFAGMRDAATLSGGTIEIRAAMDEQDEMSNMPGMKTAVKTEKQQQMEEADWLMNAVAAGEKGWDEVRGGVAERYAAAGLTEVADFIKAAAA